MPNAVRIAMFSGPRTISTTMMRAFENRPDTAVFDEPFYACYLKASGAPHPMRAETLAAQPAEWAAVVEQLKAPLPGGATIAFEKHIAFHFIAGAPLDWIWDRRVFLLIRDPRAMAASYSNKYEDVAPIAASFDVMRRIHDDCAASGAPCPVVDAADILRAPEATLGVLCAALGIAFSPAMLAWPAGPRPSDGVWAPHWYDAVRASTGFRPYVEKEVALPADLEAVAEACRTQYVFFRRRRLTP